MKRLENALERGQRTHGEDPQPARDAQPVEDLFEQIPYGLFTVVQSGSVLEMNGIGRELLLGDREAPLPTPLTCCDLICDAINDQDGDPVRCLTREALDQGAAPAEIRVELRSASAASTAWVTVAPLRGEPGAIFHLRAELGAEGKEESGVATTPRLRVFALGQTRVESAAAGSIGGAWIEQRPGQVLKYLVCSRRHVADADQIAQALWPGRDIRALSSVRYFVHALRNRLEPNEGRRRPPPSSSRAGAAIASTPTGSGSTQPSSSSSSAPGSPPCSRASATPPCAGSSGPPISTAATSSPTSPTRSGRSPSATGCESSPGGR